MSFLKCVNYCAGLHARLVERNDERMPDDKMRKKHGIKNLFEKRSGTPKAFTSRVRCLWFALFAASLFYFARTLADLLFAVGRYSDFDFDYVKFTATNGEQYAFAFTSINCIVNETTFEGAKNINFVAPIIFPSFEEEDSIEERIVYPLDRTGKWARIDVENDETFSFLLPIKYSIHISMATNHKSHNYHGKTIKKKRKIDERQQ